MEFGHKTLLNLKSPAFISQTRMGTFFNLTPHNQLKLNFQCASINIGDFCHIQQILKSLKEHNISFKKYIGQTEQLITYIAPYDLYKEDYFDVCNSENQIRVLGQNGYTILSADQYYNLASLMQPDIVIQFFDSIYNKGKKSAKHAFKKSIDFIEPGITASKQIQLSNNKLPLFLGVIQGFNSETWKESIQNALSKQIDGFVIYGISDDLTMKQKNQIYQDIQNQVVQAKKQNLPSVLSSLGAPIDILLGILNGIDFFELEYPFKLAEKGIALNIESLTEEEIATSPEKINMDEVEQFGVNTCDMLEERYSLKLDKLVEYCNCFTCTNHTASYVNHLIKCKEMTALVLLALHNVHAYNELFKAIQNAIKNKCFSRFFNAFLKKNCKPVRKIYLQPLKKGDKQLSKISGINDVPMQQSQNLGDIKNFILNKTCNLQKIQRDIDLTQIAKLNVDSIQIKLKNDEKTEFLINNQQILSQLLSPSSEKIQEEVTSNYLTLYYEINVPKVEKKQQQ